MCGCGDGQEGPISYTAPNPDPSRFLHRKALAFLGQPRLEENRTRTHNILIQLPSDQTKLHDHSKFSCILNFWYKGGKKKKTQKLKAHKNVIRKTRYLTTHVKEKCLLKATCLEI